MPYYINGVEVGRIIHMMKEPRQKPKHLNRKRRREIAKARGLLRTSRTCSLTEVLKEMDDA